MNYPKQQEMVWHNLYFVLVHVGCSINNAYVQYSGVCRQCYLIYSAEHASSMSFKNFSFKRVFTQQLSSCKLYKRIKHFLETYCAVIAWSDQMNGFLLNPKTLADVLNRRVADMSQIVPW